LVAVTRERRFGPSRLRVNDDDDDDDDDAMPLCCGVCAAVSCGTVGDDH